jgi:4-diphosphocytidyl-2-C-methyl-D-erythritol kinase
MLSEAAPAKINLFLHVTGRRDDGYHLLDSLVVFAAAGDRLRVTEADGLSLALTGPFAAGLVAEADNLVLRAARALAEAAGIAPRGHLELEKNLPVASGIGGGSADAAAALRLLARFWNVDVPDDRLLALATRLGADVPVCLASRPTRMQGIGERLIAAPVLPGFGLLLINPGVAVATADVFRARRGGFSPAADLPERWDDALGMAAGLAALSNDLQPAAVSVCPVIGDVLSALDDDPTCLLARMSGSGATCFGIYPDVAAASRAAARFGGARPGWWVWGGSRNA